MKLIIKRILNKGSSESHAFTGIIHNKCRLAYIRGNKLTSVLQFCLYEEQYLYSVSLVIGSHDLQYVTAAVTDRFMSRINGLATFK